MSLRNALVQAMGLIGLIWYYVCLFVIGLQLSSDSSAANFREFMSLSLTTIAVSLATFVGMLLGFRGVSEEIQESVREVQSDQGFARFEQIAQGTGGTRLQWIAAGLYVLSLLLALYFWWHGGDKSDPAIVNLGKSLLGLIGGALSVLFNLPRRKP
jgi:hypothetical protein